MRPLPAPRSTPSRPTAGGWLEALPGLPALQRSWLNGPGSLTWRLKTLPGRFAVRHVVSRYGLPHADEFRAIAMPRPNRVLVRDVTLTVGEVPMVVAHSVAPLTGIARAWRPVLHLGTRPLAEVLFTDPRVARCPFAFRRVDRRHPLYRQAAHALAGPQPSTLWARRSVFLLRGAPLMVTEVFLPTLWECLGVESPE